MVVASAADFSRGAYRFNSDWRRDCYRVETADRLEAVEGAFPVMRYAGGGVAAVAYDGSTTGDTGVSARSFVVGFPFESLRSEVERDRLMHDVLQFLTGSKDY